MDFVRDYVDTCVINVLSLMYCSWRLVSTLERLWLVLLARSWPGLRCLAVQSVWLAEWRVQVCQTVSTYQKPLISKLLSVRKVLWEITWYNIWCVVAFCICWVVVKYGLFLIFGQYNAQLILPYFYVSIFFFYVFQLQMFEHPRMLRSTVLVQGEGRCTSKRSRFTHEMLPVVA